MQARNTKIVVTNVFGVKNKGDQALLQSLMGSLNRVFPSADITGFATDPVGNQATYPKVKFLPLPWSLPAGGRARRLRLLLRGGRFAVSGVLFGQKNQLLVKEISGADLVIACPGGYLEDSSWSYFAHWIQLFVAIRFRRRLILAPQSVGPIRSQFGQWIIGRTLKRAEVVFVRDDFSQQFCLRKLRLSPEKVVFSPDLALVEHSLRRTDECRMPLTGKIGITMVSWGFYGDLQRKAEYIRAVREAVVALEAKEFEVVFLPQTLDQGLDSDTHFAREACVGTGARMLEQPPKLEDYLKLYDDLDCIIGSRLHSCLLAIARRVPAASISYLPKCSRIMRDLGLSNYVMDINSVSSPQIVQMVHLLREVSNRKEYFNIVDEYVGKQNAAFEAYLKCVSNEKAMLRSGVVSAD